MLKRFVRYGLLLAALALPATSFAQGLNGPGTWSPGHYKLKFHRTLASTATTPYSGVNSGSIRNAAGTVVGSFRDSTEIIRANTAGQMQFDTTSVFSLSDLDDWVPVRIGTTTAVASDSLWAFSLDMKALNDGFTAALAAGTTGGGATITADSLNYYLEVSTDGGINWNRTISLLAFTLETGTTNSFHLAFNSQFMSVDGAGTLGPANFLAFDALYRFVLVHDCAGKYDIGLTYPRALR